MCFYTTFWNMYMKYTYITIKTNKYFVKWKEKTLQNNTAANGLYDIKLCRSNTVKKFHVDHSPQICWFEVFLSFT